RAQLEQVANRGRRGLRQFSEVGPGVWHLAHGRQTAWNSDHETHLVKNSDPGDRLFCRFLGARSRREPRRSELHLVPWSIGARLYAGAPFGRTEISIYRTSA